MGKIIWRAGRSSIAAVGALALLASSAVAQTEAEKQANTWIKICNKEPIPERGADGQVTTREANLCLTTMETFSRETGMMLASAAVRVTEGFDKKQLLVTVPLGMLLPVGLRATIVDAKVFKDFRENKAVDTKDMKLIPLTFLMCHVEGCAAETEAPDELIAQMKAGAGLIILGQFVDRRPAAFSIPLLGFTAAHDGAPLENPGAYFQARTQQLAQIRAAYRERVIEAAREAQEKRNGQPKQ
ncbi:MAG: invasion associated locus B family protein [Hyphomicrobiaceae bacterium]